MRSMVGRKDVFLSYAHIHVKFAQRIKVGYTLYRVIEIWSSQRSRIY